MRGRLLAARALGVVAVHQHQHGGEERHHAEPGQQDRGARDEAQLLDAAEVREHEDEEGAAGGEGADGHARARPGGGELEGLSQVAAEEDLLLVAEEEVDAVVDADAHHDGDEHHREDA